jgi:hypothetical protein
MKRKKISLSKAKKTALRKKKTTPTKVTKVKVTRVSKPPKIRTTVRPTEVTQVVPTTVEQVKRPRKRRSKNVTKMYFTQDTEDAIVAYNEETDLDKREAIFREKIHYPFQKLVENVFNTFKFSYFETGPQDIQKETLTHLVANMHKYQKIKGKAFSYFSIIAKHYLILLNNTNYKKWLQNIEIGEDRDENTVQLQHTDKHYAQQEMSDFIRLMVEFWENNIDKIFTKQRDLSIANAVVELFRNSDRIDAYNKKALYLYIREMAMCKTQQITKVINKMKQYHDNIQRTYTEDGHVDTERYVTA